MKKKAHLSLVDTSATSLDVELIQLTPAKSRRSKEYVPTVPEKLGYFTQQLSTCREALVASMVKVRSQSVEKLKLKDLENILNKILLDESRLQTCEHELKRIAGGRLSPFEAKQFARCRKLLKEMHERLQNAGFELEELIDAKKSGGKDQKNGKKSILPKGIQLKVTLNGSDPPIWRRMQVPGDCSLGELHFTIQQSMGWQSCHLHRFTIRGSRYSDDPDDCDEELYTLQDFVWRKGSKFEYIYDFGDWWTHTIEFEKTMDAAHDVLECVDGRGACPPEDSGGIMNYYQMLEILKKPGHPEFEDVRSWLGDDFNPDQV